MSKNTDLLIMIIKTRAEIESRDELAKFGITIEHPDEWTGKDLERMSGALEDLITAANVKLTTLQGLLKMKRKKVKRG